MGNKMTLQSTKFVNLDNNGNEAGDVSYGFRLYDDYENKYVNLFSEDQLKDKTSTQLVRLAMEMPGLKQMIEEVYDLEIPFDVNGEEFDIRSFLKDYFDKESTLYRVYNIEWDTDNEDDIGDINTGIPPGIAEYNLAQLDIEKYDTIDEALSEKITEDFGFCHKGFLYETI